MKLGGMTTALLLVLISCAQDSDPRLTEGLVGEWRWVETSGGFTGETRSDPSHRWLLRFDRNGTIREEYAGRSAASGRYRIELVSDPTTDRDAVMLSLTGEALVVIQDQPFEMRMDDDTLRLASAVNDGFSYRFVRVGGG